eukprot:60027-Prymnesium_polylepis.1
MSAFLKFLMATTTPESLCTPIFTAPNAPLPRSLPSEYIDTESRRGVPSAPTDDVINFLSCAPHTRHVARSTRERGRGGAREDVAHAVCAAGRSKAPRPTWASSAAVGAPPLSGVALALLRRASGRGEP